MTNQTQTDRLAEVLDCDREAAADAVKAYRDRKNNDWQQRIRDCKCDDGTMVQAFARHRIAATQSLSTDLANAEAENARLRNALERIRLGDIEDGGFIVPMDMAEASEIADAALNPGKEIDE